MLVEKIKRMMRIGSWTVIAVCAGMLVTSAMVSGAENKPANDALNNAEKYYALHPAFAKAFAFLRRPDLAQFEPGKHIIDGEKLFCTISKGLGKKKSAAQLEAHRKYIDIHFIIAGTDEMGFKPAAHCLHPAAPNDPAKDIIFFKDPPETWIKVPANSFIIFFPKDAHAPMVSDGQLHKAVVKVAVD